MVNIGFAAGTTKQRGTRGGTTSNTRTEQEIEWTTFQGEKIYIKPKPLMKQHVPKGPEGAGAGNTAAATSKDALPGVGPDGKPFAGTATAKDGTTTSQPQSQLTSSLTETSEDDEAKKKEQEKAEKKTKKGLTEKELDLVMDIELGETNTFDLMFIPSSLVQNDAEEYTHIASENKKYEELKVNKIGSDSYT